MIRLYNVKENYISYLRSFDSKVLHNKNEKRPYVGVVCVVNSTNYYVPLASPKKKYMHMSNSKDFHKIAGGKYGVINFNNMIPIDDDKLIKINIQNETDKFYRNLLQNQYNALITIENTICKKASGIYNLYVTKNELSSNDAKIKSRCCNFPLLEKKMRELLVDNNSSK